jgi:glycosyltransferase involved in cell wall biosynthesis
MTASIKVAVDASRIKSGGGIAHLKAIMSMDGLANYGIAEVHVWSYRELLDKLPDQPWLVKHCPTVSTQSLLHQIFWQATRLAQEIKAAGCHVLFSVDATTFCTFKPMVLLHQNMIPFEKGFEKLYGFTPVAIHQRILRRVQIHAFKRAQAVVFLTYYAAERMQLYTGKLKNFHCIAHGVDEVFKQALTKISWPASNERPLQCLYVSPSWKYKHQAEVVRAIKILRDRGYRVKLTLTGGGNAEGQAIIDRQIEITDPNRNFTEQLAFVAHEEIPALMANADIFIFASSVETFGITLLEAMTVGIPIACSNRSSLPETLKDAGVYFDPQDEVSIADATEQLIKNAALRQALASKAQALAQNYSWQQCAAQTWQYVAAQASAS